MSAGAGAAAGTGSVTAEDAPGSEGKALPLAFKTEFDAGCTCEATNSMAKPLSATDQEVVAHLSAQTDASALCSTWVLGI